jgi:aminocarboxymuconate-semialdehyde decarboxylase
MTNMITSTLASIAFVGCAVARVRATATEPRRREVVVAGKRVKTVDVHAHCAVPAAMALVHQSFEAEALLMTDVGTRLNAMDAQGIDIEALSSIRIGITLTVTPRRN